MMAKGSVSVTSKSDPRWNFYIDNIYVGMFSCPQEALDKVDELSKKLGCPPPDDLEYSYMKD